MPQASKSLRAEWNGDHEAQTFLIRRGFFHGPNYTWQLPDDREPPTPTPKEQRAIQYLIDEWDWGGWSSLPVKSTA